MKRHYLRVQAPNAAVVQILNAICDESAGVGSIDFNKIAPMPGWIYQGELTPDMEQRYGAENCWKLWSIKNWGCSRNALYPNKSAAAFKAGNVITFVTEDSHVCETVRKLSLIHKEAYFDYMWADDDIGKEAGLVGYRDGEECYHMIPIPYSRHAYQMAFDVLATKPENYGLTFDAAQNTFVYTGAQQTLPQS